MKGDKMVLNGAICFYVKVCPNGMMFSLAFRGVHCDMEPFSSVFPLYLSFQFFLQVLLPGIVQRKRCHARC